MEPTRTPDLLERRAALVAEFAGAFEPQLSKVNETLAVAWRAPLERAVAEALTSMAAAQRRLAQDLAQNLRRLRQFEGESQWSNVVADTVVLAAARNIVFSINADKLRFQAARGFDLTAMPEIPLKDAAAFQASATTAEPTFALKTRGELSETLSGLIGENAGMRIAVYPITTRDRVAALVYAEDLDGTLLDLVVTAAGAALEGHMGRGPAAGSNIVTITPAAGAPFITRDEEERHSRAQRFARVQVAEIRLYHAQAVKAGRVDSNVYRALKPQIDDVRRAYQGQYLKNGPNMTDYLHQEILRTLVNGNSELLGPDYPGPLV